MNYVRTHSCQDLITQSCCHVKSACAKCGNSYYYIPLNELCGFRGLINTNWIEVLVTIFYRRGTLNKLKFDLIKKHSSDLCKRNANKIWCLSFIVLEKIRRNFAKFRHEISSKHSRIFVKRNFAVILAKFRIHWSEISSERKFVPAKFCWLACRSDGGSGWARWILKAGARGQRNREEPWSGHAG